MKKPANLKNTIKKLRALQIKAKTDLEKISKDASVKPPKVKKTTAKKPVLRKNIKPIVRKKLKPVVNRKPQGKIKAKSRVRKVVFWKRVFRIKTRTIRRRIPRNRRIR